MALADRHRGRGWRWRWVGCGGPAPSSAPVDPAGGHRGAPAVPGAGRPRMGLAGTSHRRTGPRGHAAATSACSRLRCPTDPRRWRVSIISSMIGCSGQQGPLLSCPRGVDGASATVTLCLDGEGIVLPRRVADALKKWGNTRPIPCYPNFLKGRPAERGYLVLIYSLSNHMILNHVGRVVHVIFPQHPSDASLGPAYIIPSGDSPDEVRALR